MNEIQLKYGCNPNQKPSRIYMEDGSDLPVKVLNGKPGYINFLDAFNGWQLVKELKAATGLPAATSFKHVSPAGAAVGLPLTDTLAKIYWVDDLGELSPLACAYARARGADRMSSFGDFIALSDVCDADTARLIKREVSDGVIAPGYTDEAMELLLAKKKGNYNIIQIDENYVPAEIERKQVYGVTLFAVTARAVVWACGGIGGLYEHSTNFPHLTGDALAIALKHGIELEHPDYVQIHPTTLYSPKPGRRFLISESVRGEGAKLYNAKMERFANEVLPRDLMTAEIRKQMEIDHKPYVWLDMRPLGEAQIKTHFPNIYQKCLEEGFDVTKECIPVVPAQHYFMGGVKVDKYSRTTMKCLYASGETSCNGVHGANRLASNSLLESLVFAKRAAGQITKILETKETAEEENVQNALLKKADATNFLGKEELQKLYAESVRKEIERVREEAV